MKALRFVFLFSLIFVFSNAWAQESGGPDSGQVIPLQGTVLKHSAWGPPGFGETPKHDQRVTYYILHLDKAKTAQQLMLSKSMERKKRYSYVQLSCDDDKFPQCSGTIQRLIGQRVTIVGHVDSATYPTDYVPVIVTVSLIEKE